MYQLRVNIETRRIEIKRKEVENQFFKNYMHIQKISAMNYVLNEDVCVNDIFVANQCLDGSMTIHNLTRYYSVSVCLKNKLSNQPLSS